MTTDPLLIRATGSELDAPWVRIYSEGDHAVGIRIASIDLWWHDTEGRRFPTVELWLRSGHTIEVTDGPGVANHHATESLAQQLQAFAG